MIVVRLFALGEAFLLLILHLASSLRHLLFVVRGCNYLGAAANAVSPPGMIHSLMPKDPTNNEWCLGCCDVLRIGWLCCSHHIHLCTLHFLPAEPHLMVNLCNFTGLYSNKKEYEASEWTIQEFSASQASSQMWGYCHVMLLCLRAYYADCLAWMNILLAITFQYILWVEQVLPHSTWLHSLLL